MTVFKCITENGDWLNYRGPGSSHLHIMDQYSEHSVTHSCHSHVFSTVGLQLISIFIIDSPIIFSINHLVYRMSAKMDYSHKWVHK